MNLVAFPSRVRLPGVANAKRTLANSSEEQEQKQNQHHENEKENDYEHEQQHNQEQEIFILIWSGLLMVKINN